MASYPPGKTHQEGNEADWEEKKSRSISLISYQQATMGKVNEQILNCFNISSSGALQLRFQCVCLTERLILNIIESFQRLDCRVLKFDTVDESCAGDIGEGNESGFIRSAKHFHGNHRKRPSTENQSIKEDHRASLRAELWNTFLKTDIHV